MGVHETWKRNRKREPERENGREGEIRTTTKKGYKKH